MRNRWMLAVGKQMMMELLETFEEVLFVGNRCLNLGQQRQLVLVIAARRLVQRTLINIEIGVSIQAKVDKVRVAVRFLGNFVID